MKLNNIILEEIGKLFEVRHVNFQDMFNDMPLKDDETIIVYHGFSDFNEALYAAKFGITGKERANRRFSYETVNNPNGLFVTVDFNVVKKDFAYNGVIMEFATKVSNLEAPIWAGGGSYFVQGDYTQGFNSPEEREQQRLLNREKELQSKYPAITQSDRPELAQTIYQNREQQALFIGDLNPNMIRGFWVNDKLRDEQKYGGRWINMSRNEFLRKYYNPEDIKIEPNRFSDLTKKVYPERYNDKSNKIFMPAEDFNIDKLKKYLEKQNYNYDNFVKYYIMNWDDYAMNTYFYPRQIEQIKKYFNI